MGLAMIGKTWKVTLSKFLFKRPNSLAEAQMKLNRHAKVVKNEF